MRRDPDSGERLADSVDISLLMHSPTSTDVATVTFHNERAKDVFDNERGWNGSHRPPPKYDPSLRRTCFRVAFPKRAQLPVSIR
jgi:hypothetical protein